CPTHPVRAQTPAVRGSPKGTAGASPCKKAKPVTAHHSCKRLKCQANEPLSRKTPVSVLRFSYLPFEPFRF
ncbi:MAG: hypothetical protein Q7R93_00250, partial [bacterium]|nr:hypothetical protein [bacterium]